MNSPDRINDVLTRFIVKQNHRESDYFALLVELVALRVESTAGAQEAIESVYGMVMDEILTNTDPPVTRMKFGTSGWRGILGKDLTLCSVARVTEAIVDLYLTLEDHTELQPFLGVTGLEEARERGCVVGFDNRFGGEVLAGAVVKVLVEHGFRVHYAGESTTGVLSAALLERSAAFSVNLTPSHNPLQYGGFKFNGADGGPAPSQLTNRITTVGRKMIEAGCPEEESDIPPPPVKSHELVTPVDSFATWQNLVRQNRHVHGLDYETIISRFHQNPDVAVVIDSVHGASRLHIRSLFLDKDSRRLIHLRHTPDVTFGGIAPEPSSENMRGVVQALGDRDERLKLGAIIDPDGDRIRFTDGTTEISMNQFGAMAYHFLHEVKKKKGMVAKTVATSNLANRLAEVMGEEVFEPKVGFKEFKPVIGKALVFFEESDGISIIGHTPEKDAYIGLLLALDMVLTLDKNLGDYLAEIETTYGAFYPDRDGIEVSLKGDELTTALAGLERYGEGSFVRVGDEQKKIHEVITIDGRKMIFEDGSWLMIRPSGTEPKVRFYVESRDPSGTRKLVAAAKEMLKETGLL